MSRLKLGVLVSGRGSNLQAILDAIASETLDAEVCAVLSDKPGVQALDRLKDGIPGLVVRREDFPSAEAFETALIDRLEARGAELIVLAGFMRILERTFVRRFSGRILNIHPSLLPSFPGLHAQRQALEHGVKISGCTVHLVDETLDGGPILAQTAVPVLPGDTERTLSDRILEQEHLLLPETLRRFASRRVSTVSETTQAEKGRLNMKSRVKRALISVSDKTGVESFAAGLAALGVEIVSTGGTHKALRDAGVPVTYISDTTDFPEILDGRVKTLHPAIHGGILARRDIPEHMEALRRLRISPIDLVAVNLYPFEEVARRGGSRDELIENIDIGGPSMVRSAAKNHRDVVVIVDPADYDGVLERLRTSGDCPREEREALALKAFRHTAEYDANIYRTLSGPSRTEPRDEGAGAPLPQKVSLNLIEVSSLRYGENPGQEAALYRDPLSASALVGARQLQGKQLSYNNWLDADGALRIIQEFRTPAAAIVKHTNPCGAALGETVLEAFNRAYQADPISAFGGIVAVNHPLTRALAEAMHATFWEVILAPDFEEGALEVLGDKGGLRLLKIPEDSLEPSPGIEWRSICGGFLAQRRDLLESRSEDWRTASARAATEKELRDLDFAWRIVKHVKSNAIVLVRDLVTVGIGAGQMNRVGAARIALDQAGDKARGAAMGSDAFFPFPDTVLLAAGCGVTAVVQPGGSVRDADSVKAADEHDMAMMFTGIRHFKH
jgi:phosphoribosylaminoimidazolecarboxamide formyltransferase/IMP cyclohydrolase